MTWFYFDLFSMRLSDNYTRVIQEEVPKPPITKISLEIT